jgi:cellulose synthase (UDP-forming)
MFSELRDFIALFTVLATCAWGLARISPEKPDMRKMVCWGVMGVNSIYLAWRWTSTLPQDLSPRSWLAWIYLIIETIALLESGIFWLCMSRSRPETAMAAPQPSAPAHEAKARRVEIWIPTYREPVTVLEKAVLASKAVQHPGLRVKVLDDGNRAWLKEQCKVWGVDHVTRPEHQHAKAGNLNHCLLTTEADFIVTMDADFAPFEDFVIRTLPFFEDPKLAILQTPQTFYNPDLMQQNLGLGGGVADEQALFFREIQPSRDAWDSAFFCGSCAMIRVQAVRDIGGFPTDSITEDLLTTLKLLTRGWKTRYLNERLSMGLAAESIEAFFVQRDRWSRGAIEILFLPEGPLRNPRLSLMQRILFMPLYWVIHPLFNLVIMLAPTVCLLTGLRVMMIEDTADVYLLVLPTVVFNFLCLTWISRGRFSPIISTALSMLMAVRLSYSAAVGLLGLGSKVFKVTPKGTQISASYDRLSLYLLTALSMLTLLAMLYAGWVSQHHAAADPATPWLIFLGAFNLVHFLIALALVVDRPRQRSEERFEINALLPMSTAAGALAVHVLDMSANGLKFIWPNQLPLPDNLLLEIEGARIPLELLPPASQQDPDIFIARLLTENAQQRQVLVQFLFSGRFDPVVQTAPSLADAFKKTTRAVLKSTH